MTKRFCNVWVDTKNEHSEFTHVSEMFDVKFNDVTISGQSAKDETKAINICVAGKFSGATQQIVIIDDLGNFWTMHPDLLNAYGPRLLAYMAAVTSPAISLGLMVDRHFIIVNGFSGKEIPPAYIDSLTKLFGFWSFEAYTTIETNPDEFEITQQQFEEVKLAPTMDSGLVH